MFPCGCQADLHAFRLHYNIINIRFDILSDLRLQDNLHGFLIHSRYILEAKCYLCVTKDSK
jgi:hypothetical protein